VYAVLSCNHLVTSVDRGVRWIHSVLYPAVLVSTSQCQIGNPLVRLSERECTLVVRI